MNKINIGFMGGCINNQSGINRQDLYFSVMSKLLEGDNNKMDFRISLATYLSFDQLVAQVEQLITRKKPNILFLFIRPFPLMPLQKPLVKFDNADGKKSWALHPGLFTRQLKWKQILTKNQSDGDFVFVPIRKISYRDFNLIAGLLLGLHHWAMQYVASQIEIIKTLCDQYGIELFLISPPQNPESILANLTCKWTTGYFEKYSKQMQLNFININLLSFDNFEQDNIHFNVQGHAQLGQLIYESIKKAHRCWPGI